MALPVVPIAAVAVRYGAVALAAWALTRQIAPARVDQRAEDALDELPEGVATRRAEDREQHNATARFRRVIRLGSTGPAFEIDLAALGRLRLRRV